jgi:eukaryotic-like serine/threonine-protein kinase
MQPLAPWGNFDLRRSETRRHNAAVAGKPELFAGRYEVLDLLAVVPTAAVYRANDRMLGHAVALKILRKDLAGAAIAVSRFRHEARLARRVTHPNVARVLDMGEHDGAEYVTRELAAGEGLDVLLEAKQALPLERALGIGVQLARALAAAHERGIIPCDIAAEHVFVDARGGVVVTDFSAGREGPPTSPERQDGRAASERSDLYALGALVYQMLTGTPPWGRRAGLTGGAARFSVPPARPHDLDAGIPEGVSSLVMQLLEREPAARPESARAVEIALARLAPAAAAPPRPTPSAPRPPLPTHTPRSAPARAAVKAGPPSGRLLRPRALAVLPLADVGDHKRRYVAEALASALTDRLAAVPSIRVLTRGDDDDARADEAPRVVGLRMGADAVLTGSLHLRASEDARFSVLLTSVSSGEVLWRAEIVRSPKELFKIADMIAAGVTNALDLLAPPPRSTALEPEPGDVDPFPRARAALGDYTKEGSDDAERGLAAAFLRAPNDPVLASWLALAKLQRWAFDPALGQGDEAAPVVAERIALEALKRAPGTAEAHLVLAALADARGEPVLAMQKAKEAVRLAPTLGEAHALVGRLRTEANDVLAGERDLELALRQGSQVATLLALARTRGLLRDYDRAAESLYLADAKVPGHLGALLVRLEAAAWSLDPDKIARARARAVEMTTGRSGPLVHAIRARAGLDVERELASLAALAAAPGCTARTRAWLLQTVCEGRAAAGDRAGAIAALRGVDEAGSVDVLWVDGCPSLQPLRSLSGFSDARASVHARAEETLEARP